MTEENNNYSEDYKKGKNKVLKYLGIFLIAMIGAFIGVYVAVGMFFINLLNPFYHMGQMERMMDKQEKMMSKTMKDFDKAFYNGKVDKNSAVIFQKDNDKYVVTVNLKNFDNDAKNVKYSVKDNMITIASDITKSKKHSESRVAFSETHFLDTQVNDNKITAKEDNGKLIIELPFKK